MSKTSASRNGTFRRIQIRNVERLVNPIYQAEKIVRHANTIMLFLLNKKRKQLSVYFPIKKGPRSENLALFCLKEGKRSRNEGGTY